MLHVGKTNDDSAFHWQRNEVDGKKSSYYSACVVEIYEKFVLLLQPVMSFQNLAVRILREKAAILELKKNDASTRSDNNVISITSYPKYCKCTVAVDEKFNPICSAFIIKMVESGKKKENP